MKRDPLESRPLVSVVMPVLNGARYLREAVDSVLAQRYSPLELIVMDDASTDETPEILASYGDRITVTRQEQTRGIYDNVNDAILSAKGEYIAFYHADDVYLPNIVEREVAYFEAHPEVGAVFASDIFTDENGREYDRLVLPPMVRGERPLNYAQILNALLTHKNTFLRCPGVMVRAETHRLVGVYRQTTYKNTADLDMWLRIAQAQPIAILEEHLFRYRHFHGNSSQRYHYLRTEPGRIFRILDDYLAAGGKAMATESALSAYEAHRAEDMLHRAVSHYIRSQLPQALGVLRQVSTRTIARGHTVSRVNLLGMWTLLQVLCRLPRNGRMADAFHRRWHAKSERILK